MNHGIYVAAAGAIANDKRFDIISNNLANVNTTGFKKERVSFSDMLSLKDSHNPLMKNQTLPENFKKGVFNSFPFVDKAKTDFSQGFLKKTGNNLDVAISGKGFFMIKDNNGNIKFTRNGNFTINNSGLLVTKNGEQVLDLNYNLIQLPTSNVKSLYIDEKANIYVNNAFTAKIAVMSPDEKLLKHEGDSNYIISDKNYKPRESDEYSVEQGYLEGSNVNIVKEMTSMIEIMRLFQANQKVITTIDSQLDARAVNDVGRLV
jgi:flagellar basal-body rod protein FlgF